MRPSTPLSSWSQQLASIATVAIVLSCTGSDSGTVATTTIDTLQAVEIRRIASADADFSSSGRVVVSRSGDIIATQSRDQIVKVIRPNGEIETIGRDGDGPGEFRSPSSLGWLGDSLWVLEARNRRISIFDSEYNYVRRFNLPSEIVSETSKSTSVEVQQPEARLSGIGSLMPGGFLRSRASWPGEAEPPDWDGGSAQDDLRFVQVTETGEFVSFLAALDAGECNVTREFEGGFVGTVIPFCKDYLGNYYAGGDLLVLVEVVAKLPDDSRYRLRSVGGEGEVLFDVEQSYRYIAVPDSVADAAMADREAMRARMPGGRAPPEVEPAKSFAPVRNVVLGRDSTVWLELEERLPEHTWLVFNKAGVPIFTVAFSNETSLSAAKSDRVWAWQRDENDVEDLVVFDLVPIRQ